MATETLVPPGPTPSCRVDYGTWSFKLTTLQSCEDLLNFGWQIGHHVLQRGEMHGPRTGRLFSEVWSHDSGVQVEFTPPDSDKRNAGTGILTVPGSVFAALDSSERVALYLEIHSYEGYYRCTRLDTQLTVLQPPVNIFRFVRDCNSGLIWPKGYSASMPYQEMDRAGNFRKPPSMYWGTPDSPSRIRVYDHGAKWEWPVETLRFEVQQRKRNADDTFRALVNAVKAEVDTQPLFLAGEANLVKAVKREKADLRDTTDVDREALGGKWLRKAPRLKWYAELVDAPGAPVERTARPVPTLGQSMDASIDQYGGNIGAWCLQTMALEGCTFKQAAEAYVLRAVGKMTDVHRQRAKTGLTEDQQRQLDKLYAKYTTEASRMAEHSWCE